MSQLSAEDEQQLQTLLKQLLRSINERISAAPSTECAEEILLHLEETDKNFHNYEFVKYLRQYVESSLGAVVEEETKSSTRADGQHAIGSGHDTLIHAVTRRTRESDEYQQMMQTLKSSMIMVVESLINKFEEDQLRKEELHREQQHSQSNSQYADNCSDSDSSFNQSYAFIRQEQLQALAEQLDSSRPKEVRWEALQALCCAPPSDVLSCESWSSLRRNLCAALSESDPDLSENVLQFFAKSFSSSPLNVTREIYTSLAHSVESMFLNHKLNFAAGVDISRPEISRPLKQIRLMNDFQKEVTTFWIRHPEKYMEEVIESTFSLLSFHHERGSSSPRSEKTLEPVHLLALLDVKAAWFKKWMHGFYSRTVVLRLLERKYKSVVVAAVQQCVHYSESCERFTDESADLQPAERLITGSVQRSVYTRKELEYAFFVHSLCVLGKLLIYTNGRKLFPIKVKNRKDPVSLTDLVVILINIMYQHPKPPHHHAPTSHTECVSPSGLVMELLWTLCERNDSAAETLHHSAVIQTLLDPVIALLHHQQVRLNSPAATLTLIADVLARIANTDGGLSLFLYEKNLLLPHSERSSAAHVIVQFTLKLLDKDLKLLDKDQSSLSESAVCHSLCGAFILVCRQMYNTCEGLQTLRLYGLHKAAAAAWRKTSSLSERIVTPVPEADAAASSEDPQHTMGWDGTLLDSLLNFSVTPKGFLLLQQSGAMNECVSYMFSRFTKKLQVSRCEKFGYGVMVTQLAATAPGVAALHRSGISFLSLVNLLSSSQSVWELLARQPLANKSDYTLREMPTSIPDLIDRLVAVNADVKIHSLFHYEQSHTFGLRLLSVLCCNLDSFLLLESQYNICSMLLQSQRDNMADGSFIIDGLSVERNHVLVRVGLVGGSSERKLPPRALQQGEEPFPWPMFSSFPPPLCYSLDPVRTHHNSLDPEMSLFLASFKDSQNEASWMEVCRRHYSKVLSSKPHILTGRVLADLLEKVVNLLSSSASDCFFGPAQYGCFLKLLTDDAAADLTLLMKHMKMFLSTQRVQTSSQLTSHQDGYPGHDWLTCTVFLLTGGDVQQSLRLLLGLSSLLTSAFIWPARIHSSVHVPVEAAESGIPPVYWCTAHYVELLLKAELPLVQSAFRMSGFTPSQMCLHWLTQCFWNYLDWTEICHYVSTCVLMGPDYQVYMCVAVLKHLQPEILQRTQAQELQVFLKEEPIQDFKVSRYLDFMEDLERSYRSIVLSDMKTVCDPADRLPSVTPSVTPQTVCDPSVTPRSENRLRPSVTPQSENRL
ncbi:protein broad-minded [Scomber japonicus]|uniref:protein broad-minded n=1 Tax=Scomber japonicus TaxID=13676 RepID=UPI00230501C5|nr:protein broad-minded [Scomber japonicus]